MHAGWGPKSLWLAAIGVSAVIGGDCFLDCWALPLKRGCGAGMLALAAALWPKQNNPGEGPARSDMPV